MASWQHILSTSNATNWLNRDTTADTYSNSDVMNSLSRLMGRIKWTNFWPPRLPELAATDFYLWGLLKWHNVQEETQSARQISALIFLETNMSLTFTV